MIWLSQGKCLDNSSRPSGNDKAMVDFTRKSLYESGSRSPLKDSIIPPQLSRSSSATLLSAVSRSFHGIICGYVLCVEGSASRTTTSCWLDRVSTAVQWSRRRSSSLVTVHRGVHGDTSSSSSANFAPGPVLLHWSSSTQRTLRLPAAEMLERTGLTASLAVTSSRCASVVAVFS